MPGSKPIAVRGIDDVHTASYGGFRKPKPKEEYSQGSPDIAGGGYTATQTDTDRYKLMMLFIGVPVLFLAAIGLVGWLTFGGVPSAVQSTCDSDGYNGSFNRKDFDLGARTATITVEFVDASGQASQNTGTMTLSESVVESLVVSASVSNSGSAAPVTCEVVSVDAG